MPKNPEPRPCAATFDAPGLGTFGCCREVFYRLIQLTGATQAEERLAEIKTLPIEIVPAREGLVMEAARIKAGHRLAYADAFAVATGRVENAPIITGNPEILALPAAVIRTRKLARNA